MSVAMFYHLTRSTVEETMATLLPRALSQGWRVMVRGCQQDTLERLDHALWLGPEDGFLPHGLQGGPHDADQPILLGTGAITNDARALMLVESAVTTPAEAAPLERVWVIFDGADQVALTAARALWTALTGAGLAAQYWSEESGRWEKKTEKAAR
jgi:DNA polymerase-3 subunit chi